MPLRLYLIFMVLGTILCWTAWGVVLMNIDPTISGWVGLSFFYISLFLALVGTVSIIGFMIHKSIFKDTEIVFRHVRKTFRQSIILAILVLVCLELLRIGWLYWWNALLLILFGLTIEGIIFSKRKFSNVEL